MAGLSLRSNFIWALAGNVTFAACQWGMFVSLVKLGSTFMAGQFSLGLAIATPVLTFTNLNLRAVQASDAVRLYSFGEYLQLRLVTSAIALAAIATATWVHQFEHDTAMIVLAVALAKGTESLSDIHYGLFQLNDRLDQTGRSMMLRGLFSVLALSGGLYFTGQVFWGCIAMALVWMAALIGWDSRQGWHFLTGSRHFNPVPKTASLWHAWSGKQRFQRQLSLMRLSLPLGIVTTLASINLNMPRYFIAAKMGEYQLGIFSALAYVTVALTLVGDSLGSCAMPGLSRLYAGGHIAEFQLLLLKLSAAGGVFGLTALAAVHLAGKQLLAMFYGPVYAACSPTFMLLMLAAVIHCLAGMLTNGIMAARRFRIQVPIFFLVTAISALACWRLVPGSGLNGAALGMVVGAVVRLTLTAGALAHLVVTCARRPQQTRSVSERRGESWISSL